MPSTFCRHGHTLGTPCVVCEYEDEQWAALIAKADAPPRPTPADVPAAASGADDPDARGDGAAKGGAT